MCSDSYVSSVMEPHDHAVRFSREEFSREKTVFKKKNQ